MLLSDKVAASMTEFSHVTDETPVYIIANSERMDLGVLSQVLAALTYCVCVVRISIGERKDSQLLTFFCKRLGGIFHRLCKIGAAHFGIK